MPPALTLRKATRQKTKIRIGLSGPSGSGKTYSALLLASGMAPWDKIAIIDTENGSGDLYAHLGEYSVITLTAPFTPERYIEAIQACDKAGMDVIVIDSVSHEWDGKGGLLESNELLGRSKFKGNTWAAWSETTPRHQKFIEAILTAQCHVITTARSKTDTIQTEDKKIKKVGLKEIQREGFEYELTLNFTLDRDGHYAIASKDRTELFINQDPFKIAKETGAAILEWARSGAEPPPPPPPTVTQVNETLTACVAVPPLQQLYDRAFSKYSWSRVDAGHISECFINRYAVIQKLRREGDKLFNEANFMAAHVERDEKTGKVKLAEHQSVIADQEMAEAERAGMQQENTAAEPPPPETPQMAPAPDGSAVLKSSVSPAAK